MATANITTIGIELNSNLSVYGSTSVGITSSRVSGSARVYHFGCVCILIPNLEAIVNISAGQNIMTMSSSAIQPAYSNNDGTYRIVADSSNIAIDTYTASGTILTKPIVYMRNNII